MVSSKVSITLVLFFCINLISTNIYASILGGWTLGGGVANGASVVYEATKKVIIDGKDYIKKGAVTITPTATQVAKTIGRTAGVIVAIEALIGAVDWVLDPANNRVVYYEDPPAKEMLPKLWVWDTLMEGKDGVSSASDACKKAALSKAQAIKQNNYMYTVYKSVSYNGEDSATCEYDAYNTYTDEKYPGVTTHIITRKVNTAYNPEAADEREEKFLPYDAVAQKLISNAEAGDATAQAHTAQAAAAEVAEAEKDEKKGRPIAAQAEASATTTPADTTTADNAGTATGSQTQNPTKPDTTDLKLEFPVFCNWAPIVCEAAQVVISFPNTLTDWWEISNRKADGWANSISQAWTSIKDWMKEEPTNDNDVEIQEKQLEQKTVDLNFGSACPAPVVLIDSTFYDQPFKIEYSFNDFCSILSDFVRPVLIAMGAFIAALILGGVKTNE